MHCARSSSVGCVFWKETARTRKNNSVFQENSTATHIEYKKGNFNQSIEMIALGCCAFAVHECKQRWGDACCRHATGRATGMRHAATYQYA